MPRLYGEDHQICDVDQTDAHVRTQIPQEGDGLDSLEGGLHAEADNDDIWVAGGVARGELKDGGSCFTVGLGRFGRKVDGCRLFGADEEVGVGLGEEAVVDGGKEAVRVGGEVDLDG